MENVLKTCQKIIQEAIPGEPDSLYRKIFKFLQDKDLLKYRQKRNASELILTPTKNTKVILSWVKKEIKKQGKL